MRCVAMLAAGVVLAGCAGVQASGDTAASTVASVPSIGPASVPTTGSAPSTDPVAPESNAPDGTDTGAEPAETEIAPLVGNYTVQIVAQYEHDPSAYTQGLEFVGDELLESAGRYGESSLRRVDPENGVEVERRIADDLFAEGLTVVDDVVWQLTWTSEQALRYDLLTLEPLEPIGYLGEGWGLCFDGDRLVRSDGSDLLTFHDPIDFTPIGSVPVRNQTDPIVGINELECRGDQVLANIYGADQIVAIDPDSGSVDAVIDASELRPADLPIEELDFALNGIAAEPIGGNLFLTGKLWPVLYEVSLVAVP